MGKNNNKGVGVPGRVVKPAPIVQIRVTYYSDDTINVTGFPGDYTLATDLMLRAAKAVSRYFFRLAREGKLDDNNVVKDQLLDLVGRNKKIISP